MPKIIVSSKTHQRLQDAGSPGRRIGPCEKAPCGGYIIELDLWHLGALKKIDSDMEVAINISLDRLDEK